MIIDLEYFLEQEGFNLQETMHQLSQSNIKYGDDNQRTLVNYNFLLQLMGLEPTKSKVSVWVLIDGGIDEIL